MCRNPNRIRGQALRRGFGRRRRADRRRQSGQSGPRLTIQDDQTVSPLRARLRVLPRQPTSAKPISIIAQVPGSGTALVAGTSSRGWLVGKLTGPLFSPGGVNVEVPGADARIVASEDGGANGACGPGGVSPTGASGGCSRSMRSAGVPIAGEDGFPAGVAAFGRVRTLAA